MPRCGLAVTAVALALAGTGSAAVSRTQASVYEAFDAEGAVLRAHAAAARRDRARLDVASLTSPRSPE